ncbi:MAG: polysaccharide lyase family 8 super-sandwich domain-containing protein [Bacteroidota bacterium]
MRNSFTRLLILAGCIWLSTTQTVFAQFPYPIDSVRSKAIGQALLFPAESRSVAQIRALMNANGSFTDRGPDLYIIEKRIRKLAQEYYANPSWQGNTSLKNDIYQALEYWFNNATPGVGWGDWTNTDIKMPRWMGRTMILMYDAITADIPSNPQAVALRNHVQNFYNTYVWGSTNGRPGSRLGANLSARLEGAATIGAFLNSPTILQVVQDSASSSIMLGAGTQTQYPNYAHHGFTTDYSFHHHNDEDGRMIWGNYGWVLISNFSFYIELVGGSPWDLSSAEYQRMFEAITEGARYFSYKGKYSLSVGGRKVLRETGYGSSNNFGKVLRILFRTGSISPDGFSPAEVGLLSDMWTRYTNPSSPQVFNSSKYFYTSDCLAHSRPDHHVVIKMLSDRNLAIEIGTGYPTRGYHLTDGSTFFMITGEEYLDSRVVWNYTAIPGTTIEQKAGQPLQTGPTVYQSSNTFAGGVSDGIHSVSGFDYNRTHSYSTVRAQKSYFLFDEDFIFLGSKVRQTASPNGDIWTTVNQAERKGTVTYNTGSGTNSIPLGTNTTQDFNGLNQIAWFHHDGMGYVIVPNGNIDLKLWADNRTGTWRSIDQSNSNTSNQSRKMFQLSINHGANPSNDTYSYLVFPNVSAADMPAIASNLPIAIVKHTDDAHVVHHASEEITQAMLYANNQDFQSPLGFQIASDKPAVIQLSQDTTVLKLSVSDPMQQETSITLTIEGELSGPNTTYNSSTNESTVTVNLPQGIYAGNQVDIDLSLNGTSLPVELADFSGIYKGQKSLVELSWSTASEINSDYFEVLRSANGFDFEKIGEIKASGYSQTSLNYSFEDRAPLIGENYYRLRMVDIDGSEEFSKIIVLNATLNKSSFVKVYPNPWASTNPLTIEAQLVGEALLEGSIVDLSGRTILLLEHGKTDNRGRTSWEIPRQKIASGVYFLRLEGRDQSQVLHQKIIIQP